MTLPSKVNTAKLAGMLLPVAIVVLCVLAQGNFDGVTTALLVGSASKPLALALSLALLGVVAWRTVLWLRYRPLPRASDLPRVSIVIPAFNEGRAVRRAILSAAQSDYDPARVEILCVDDGSSDDTLTHARRACSQARALGVRAEAVRLPTNQGKRHALYAGMTRAQHDVIVTLDSDSELEPEALANLVSPLQDEQVGAVSGRVLVRNRDANLLTRMLWVQYAIGFDFTRAYQSTLGTVFCVPGACAAYSRPVIAPSLERWRDQTFLGARCTNGDDHHLTNRVLEAGYDVVYQSSATVHTEVPTTYRRLTRMYTRWARSNVRESLWYLGFALQRAWRTRKLLPLIDAVLKVISNVSRPVAFVAFAFTLLLHPALLPAALLGATVGGALYALYYLRFERSSEALYGVLYAYFSLLALQWIQPWATLTVRSNRWLTR